MLHPSGRVFSQTNRSTPYGTPACHGAGAENRWFRGLDDVYWCQDRGHILSARIAKIWAFFFGQLKPLMFPSLWTQHEHETKQKVHNQKNILSQVKNSSNS